MKNMSHFIGKVVQAVLLFVALFSIQSASAYSGDDTFKNTFIWEEISPIPPSSNEEIQHGLSAPFAGYTNGVVIVAGGCNFPDEPVYENGKKKYYDDIFILDQEGNEWTQGTKFPYPIAYGASVSTEKGVVCIGGNNLEQSFAKVHVLKWNDVTREVEIQVWPDLPFNMANMAAALVGDVIYVAGGKADD